MNLITNYWQSNAILIPERDNSGDSYELISELQNVENENSSITNSTLSQFKNLRNNYLSQWEEIPFQVNFNSFIVENSTAGYGIFLERNSSMFNLNDRVELYVEPIGFKHQPIVDSKGKKLYLTNITAIISMQDYNGNEIPSIEDLQSYVSKSHNKITELFLPIDLVLIPPLSVGNYTINYTFIDQISNQEFDLQKNVTIS